MKIKQITFGIALFSMALMFVPVISAVAQEPKNENTAVTPLEKSKDAAVKEITRRIDALNKAIARINDTKKLSATDKSALVAKAQQTIDDLNVLKTKIAADADAAAVKADRADVRKNYRVFILLIPQIHILAAADRVIETVDLLTDAATKLETKIADAKTAGKDVASLETLLVDMKTKLADAKVQADKATASVSALLPDEGVAAKMEANKKALTDGRTAIKAAVQDLAKAREDAGKIKSGLEALI